MTKTNTTPEVRFAGFTEDWEERELGEVAIFNPKQELPEVFNYVDLESVVGTEMISYRKENKITAPSRAQRLAEKGDVLYQTVRPYQKNNLLFNREDKNFVFSTGYAQMRPNIESSFLFTIIQKDEFVRIVLNNCTGTSYPAINSTVLASLKQHFPKSKHEQKLIGNFFENIDKLITEHQQKHRKLTALKQAMLNKMFPEHGQLVPEIRFKGFEAKWEDMDFGNIFINIPNNSLSRENLNYDSGVAKNVHYGDILVKFNEVLDVQKEVLPFITDDEIVEKLKSNFLENGDIIIADAAEDESVGKCVEIVNISHCNILSGLHTIAIRPKRKFAQRYLGYYMNSNCYHDQLIRLMQGTKVLSISKSALKNTKIQFPVDYEEQKMIGNYFKYFDRLITNHQTQINKLQNIKKAFLDKMFI